MTVDFQRKESYNMHDLLRIMQVLRAPGGCPWDKEQTHASIRKNFVEETYEVCEAIDNGDTALLCEELGDVLLQVVFHAQMEAEQGSFCFDDVCNGICQKLITRHPHIFGDVDAKTSDDVLRNWDAIKKSEKGQETAAQTLNGVSKALPALMRSGKVQQRAARAGFDYPDKDWALRDLHREVDELTEAVREGDAEHCEEELGDVLFSAVNVSRFLKLDAEEALGRSCEKFIARFTRVEQLAAQRGLDMKAAPVEELEKLWREAKTLETEEQ